MPPRFKSRRTDILQTRASQAVGGPTNSDKTIATRSATLIEVWVNVFDVGVAGVLDVFYDILPDGVTQVEQLSSTGITTTGLTKVGVLSVGDKDAIGLAGRARWTVAVNAVEFEIFALVRE